MDQFTSLRFVYKEENGDSLQQLTENPTVKIKTQSYNNII